MKMIKKLMAMFLAIAVLLTGLYIAPEEAEKVHASTDSTVNTDMLNVKFQVTQSPINEGEYEGKYIIRFVSSVDSLAYSAVGFDVSYYENIDTSTEKKTKTSEEQTKVFRRITSKTEGLEYTFGPKVVDTSSEYLVTAKMYAEKEIKYSVTAFVVTKTGEKVSGQSRCVTVEDGLDTTETTLVTFEKNSDTTYTEGQTDVTVTSSAHTDNLSATIVDVNGTMVTARIADVAPSTLPSATTFTFGEGESVIFRNTLTSHTQVTENETVHADTSWYTQYLAAGETEFVIATTADLYGFASLVNNDNTFGTAKAYLCADLVVNTAPEDMTSWSSADYAWTPIGTYSSDGNKYFQGKFDGHGHSISGLYFNQTSQYVGLFGATASTSYVQNVTVQNSYFNVGTEKTQVSAISGCGGGNFNNINVEDVVLTGKQHVGGILGYTYGETTVTNCCVNLIVNCSDSYAGGVIGTVKAGPIQIQCCMVNGTITANKNSGGILGYVLDGDKKIKISACKVEGTVTASTQTSGGIIGYVKGTSTATAGSIYVGECWISSASIVTSKQQSGGVIGNLTFGTLTVSDTLVEGNVKGTRSNNSKATKTGGICGYLNPSTAILTVTKSLVIGNIEDANYSTVSTGVGILVGVVDGSNTNGGTTLNYDDVYYREGCCQKEAMYGSMKDEYATVNAGDAKELSSDQLTGDSALTNAPALFEGDTPTWVTVQDSTPIPAVFAE